MSRMRAVMKQFGTLPPEKLKPKKVLKETDTEVFIASLTRGWCKKCGAILWENGWYGSDAWFRGCVKCHPALLDSQPNMRPLTDHDLSRCTDAPTPNNGILTANASALSFSYANMMTTSISAHYLRADPGPWKYTFNGDVEVQGDLKVEGDITVNGTLKVGGKKGHGRSRE